MLQDCDSNNNSIRNNTTTSNNNNNNNNNSNIDTEDCPPYLTKIMEARRILVVASTAMMATLVYTPCHPASPMGQKTTRPKLLAVPQSSR
jgi:hypothetical protein